MTATGAPPRRGVLPRSAENVWPAERQRAALAAFFSRHGRSPRRDDFTPANGLPSATTAAKEFGSVAKALEAAGLPANKSGRPRKPKLDDPAPDQPPRRVPISLPPLTGHGARVLFSLVVAEDGTHVRELAAATGLPRADVIEALCELDAAGIAQPWAWQSGPEPGKPQTEDAARLLDALRQHGPGVNVANLARAAGVDKPRTRELLSTLESDGYAAAWSWAPTDAARALRTSRDWPAVHRLGRRP